jgi:hypothetical protein
MHHFTAHNMYHAAMEGCYICSIVWGRLDAQIQEDLLKKEAESTSAEDFTEPFAFAVLFDFESVLKDTVLDSLKGAAGNEAKVWAVAFRADVMQMIKAGPRDLAMFALVSEKGKCPVDRVLE